MTPGARSIRPAPIDPPVLDRSARPRGIRLELDRSAWPRGIRPEYSNLRSQPGGDHRPPSIDLPVLEGYAWSSIDPAPSTPTLDRLAWSSIDPPICRNLDRSALHGVETYLPNYILVGVRKKTVR
jgi:hypothetical protein